MTCAHITSTDKVCGRPAVALWRHPVLGDWWQCKRHDDRAILASLPEWLRIAEMPAEYADPLTLAETAA
jgi:hypothetical protein